MFSTRKRALETEVEGLTYGEFMNALEESRDTASQIETARTYLSSAIPRRNELKFTTVNFNPQRLVDDFKEAKEQLEKILLPHAPVRIYSEMLIEQLGRCWSFANEPRRNKLLAALCLQRVVAIATVLNPDYSEIELAIRLLRHAGCADPFVSYRTAEALAACRRQPGLIMAELEDWAAHLAGGKTLFPNSSELGTLRTIEAKLLKLRDANPPQLRE